MVRPQEMSGTPRLVTPPTTKVTENETHGEGTEAVEKDLPGTKGNATKGRGATMNGNVEIENGVGHVAGPGKESSSVTGSTAPKEILVTGRSEIVVTENGVTEIVIAVTGTENEIVATEVVRRGLLNEIVVGADRQVVVIAAAVTRRARRRRGRGRPTGISRRNQSRSNKRGRILRNEQQQQREEKSFVFCLLITTFVTRAELLSALYTHTQCSTWY